MKKETLERIVKATKNNEKLIVITNVIESHGGYSASNKELKLSKENLSLKDDCVEINMPIKNVRNIDAHEIQNCVRAASVADHYCMKATMYVEYESIIAVIAISGENKAVKKY